MLGISNLLTYATRILNRVLVLACAAVALFDLMRSGDVRSLAAALDWCRVHPNAAVAVAAALLVLNLDVIQFLCYSIANAPSRAYIESRTQGGGTRVALSALKKALQETARQVSDVSRCKVDVSRVGMRRFRVRIRYWVADAAQVVHAAEHLRLVLKKRFSELVVLDPRDRVEFDLDLRGIKGSRKRPRKQLPAPKESFQGPVYPV